MLMTFGEAMRELIGKKNLSATAVAENLGFKSRTAFFRILRDESRMPAILNCFEEIKKSALLAPSEQELAQLREAIYVSEIGKQAYAIHRVLHKMVYPKNNDETSEITIEGEKGTGTLEDVMARLRGKKKINVVILGRCSKRLMDRLHLLTKETDIHKIVHLFALDEEDAEDIKVFAEISEILFSDLYSVYYLNETGVGLKRWWLRSGIIMFSFEDDEGQRSACQLTWLKKSHYFFSESDSQQLKAYWDGLIRNVKDQLIPLKLQTEAEESMDIRHYVEFTRQYRKLEQNREIYTIRPDFPIICVPVEILAPPIIDAFSQFYPEETEEFTKQISQLYDIHQARVNNLYKKRKATHIVLNADAMMRFAKTGSRSDHFFSTRPYTPQERIHMLSLLRDQIRDNPYFHIWMSRDGAIISDREITIYDGYGVALIKGNTSWRLDHDHQEIMLESKMLAQHFKSYYTKGILASSLMTKEETIALFDEMIDMVKTL